MDFYRVTFLSQIEMGFRNVSVRTLALWLLVVKLSGTLAAEENWGLTKFDVKKVDYEYFIKQYPYHSKSFGQFISSPLFWGDDSREIKWQLRVYPRGFKATEPLGTSVYLTLVTKRHDVPVINAIVQVSIINNLGEKVNTLKFNHRYNRVNQTFGWPTFAGYYYIETAHKTLWLPNDTLTIQAEIEFSVGMIRASTQCSTIEIECYSLPFNNSLLSDVDIWVGESIKAHKAALIAHSAWFENLLGTYPQKISISLEGESAEVVKQVIQFIYTGKADTSEDMLEKLLEFSDKYGMDKLKLHCEAAFCKQMTGRNAGFYFKLADKYDAKNLKREAQNYIVALDEGVTK